MEIINKRVYIKDEEEYHDLEEDHFGMCLACGEEHYNCEPDASGYTCEMCSEKKVEGMANLLMMGRIELLCE